MLLPGGSPLGVRLRTGRVATREQAVKIANINDSRSGAFLFGPKL
jgi:hypothetical protein